MTAVSRLKSFISAFLATIALNAVAQTDCDTLTDSRVVIWFTESHSLLPGDNTIIPAPLREGDTVAIVTPAGEAHNADFDQMVEALESEGLHARVGQYATGRHGEYGGTVSERLSDFTEALLDPSIKAIICTRGGYGAVHLIDSLDALPLRKNAKWLVGFSDISALHALMSRHAIASIHGPMGINLKSHDGQLSPSCQAMFKLLKGKHVTYEIEPHPYNRQGESYGQLTGGNLAVIDGLVSTPFDVIKPGTILFIEDVSEPVYKVERQLYKLKLSGVLENLAGLIVGDFTDTDRHEMETMIRRMTDGYDFPIAFGVPAGHSRVNIPLILNAPVMMEVTADGTTIMQ